MKSITSAIRPRRRKLTNDSASLGQASAGSSISHRDDTQPSPSSFRLGSLVSSVVSSFSSSNSNSSSSSNPGDSTAVNDDDTVKRPRTSTMRSAVPTFAASLVSPAPYTDQHFQPLYEDHKEGLLSYFHKMPLHIPGFGRHNSSAPPPYVDPNPRPSSIEPTSTAQSLVDSENGFIKRVSSTPGNLSLFRAHLVDPFSHPEFRAAPRYTRHQPIILPANEPDDTPLYGYALLALTSVLFVFSMYSLVVSKLMPYTGIDFLDAIKDDYYYCLLMPITGLSFTFAIFWNWLGMKFFRHN